MIPKKIHYIWLGGRKKSKLTEVCINSWKRHLPDYEIIEWNESNIDMDALCKENEFFKKCYELKLWAFVSDFLRLWILKKEGGIYLDTDVEVLKNFDPLLDNDSFIGYEKLDYICTAIIGATVDNKLIGRLLNFYDKEIWNVDFINNPIIFRYLQDHEPNIYSNCKMFPQVYFSPYDPDVENTGCVESAETYTIHWYSNDWNMSRKGYVFMHTKHIKNPVLKGIEVIHKNIGYSMKKR